MATFQAPDQAQPTPISDVPWPKRANKACCNCRRDKIKCDGERPCAACLRRGLSQDKCIDGCPPCRRSRARCDGADPCARCIELGINCSDEQPSPSMSMDESTNKSSTSSMRSTPTARAKLACLACRRDNKKCDDNRPCMRCISRMEECVHVERIPKAVKHRCTNCRKENKKCEDTRPCRHCIDSNLECIDAPRKGSGGTRVKMACTNCRRNKVQCDPERPCKVCVRRGLECTMPSCTCAEGGLEPGTCSFCRSQGSKRNSQTANDSSLSRTSEECQTVASNTPPPSASSNVSSYGFDDFRASQAPPPSHEHRITSQGQSFAAGIQMSTDAFPRGSYTQNYISDLTPSTNPFDYHSRLINQEPPVYFPQQTHPEYSSAENTFADIGNGTANTGNGGGLDKYMTRDLGMGGSSAHPGDSSVHAGFIPSRYEPSAQHAPASQPSQSSSPFMQPAAAAVAHGVSAPPVSDFDDGGVGVGFGAYATEGMATYAGGDPSGSYGPVPMAMPVSMTIRVPQGSDLHSRQDAAARIAGQMEAHPQLRRSANYLTSESRTVQR